MFIFLEIFVVQKRELNRIFDTSRTESELAYRPDSVAYFEVLLKDDVL